MAKKKLIWLVVAVVVLVTASVLIFPGQGDRPDQSSLFKSPAQQEPEIYVETSLPDRRAEGILRSFGDGFSGLGYIDREATNMFLDYNTTAFSFPPLYEIKKEAHGGEFGSAEAKSCFGPVGRQKCLMVKNNKIYINEAVVPWPAELAKESILSVNTQKLTGAAPGKWIVGIVTGQGKDERGWVYFFNSREFTPLITKTTTAQLELKYGRTGGKIYFSDNLDDFLILYSGYDGRAFYYHDGALSDVSRFFGLRVTAGGFPAQIIRTANPRGSVFYICSQDYKKFKLMKLWSRRPGELSGALDFSFLLDVPDSTTSGCRIDSTATSSSAVKIDIGFKLGKGREVWSLIDKGFDNSRDWEVVSNNLLSGGTQQVLAANFSQISLYDDRASSSPAQLFLANGLGKWQEAGAHSWYRFSQPTAELYWRAVFPAEAGDSNYSPWFDSLNELLYRTNK